MCVRSKESHQDVNITANMSAANARKEMQKKVRKQKREAMQNLAKEKRNIISSDARIEPDLLAIATSKYHTFMISASDFYIVFQQSNAYKVLFHTTQPAHVITLAAVITITALVYPRPLSTSAGQQSSTNGSPLMNFIYLSAFMTHYGSQMWMTFVSGLYLYFALPRHTFGGVQKVLFPKYFGINSFLSLVTLIVFVKLHPTQKWDSFVVVQVCALSLCFILELMIRLYLTPPLLELITAKNAIEKAAGVGLEVGEHSVGSLATCPHYASLHKAFRTVHMSVAMGNIVAMGCTTLHIWYLAHKICMV